jgi:hypothetical protein
LGTKKKSGILKQSSKHREHYCKICGEHKANEKFSGKGHAAHICKACASKSPAQKSEDMTINRLHGMMFRYLNEADMKWLKNRRNDEDPEVKELARAVFEEKFPRQARNEIKAQLHIVDMVFHIRGEVMNEYGDEYYVNVEFTADTTGKITKKIFDDNEVLIEEKSVDIDKKAMRKFFNVAVHNYDISFWDTDLCGNNSYDPDIDDDFDSDDSEDEELDEDIETEQPDDEEEDTPDDKIPDWSVEIEYSNRKMQNTKDYDGLPYEVIELYDDFNSYFEEDEPDEEFDEN